jgi:hypothetical protein
MNSLIYGQPKVGKSTFASQIPNALFLATEEGLNSLEVYKVSISSWEDFLQTGRDLVEEKHDYQTLVIDIGDYLYKYCEHYICRTNNVKHVSDLPFGKGYSLVKDEFIRAILKLNALGFGLVFISHAKEREQAKKTIKTTYMDTSMGNQASQAVCGLCDFILYFYIDDSGKRCIRTKPSKYINAGDRTALLPEIMEMNYQGIADVISGGK